MTFKFLTWFLFCLLFICLSYLVSYFYCVLIWYQEISRRYWFLFLFFIIIIIIIIIEIVVFKLFLLKKNLAKNLVKKIMMIVGY